MSGRKRPTIRDVAERAGVSQTTAAVVLSGKRPDIDRFPEATQRKVRRAAEELGYSRNLLAASLRTGKSQLIGLLMDDAWAGRETPWFSSPLNGQLLSGVNARALELGYTTIVRLIEPGGGMPDPGSVSDLVDLGADGIVVKAPSDEAIEEIKRRRELGVPAVVVFPQTDVELGGCVVEADNVAVGRGAAELLAELGYDHIGWYGLDEPETAEKIREQSFLGVLRERGIRPDMALRGTTHSGKPHEENVSHAHEYLSRVRPRVVYGLGHGPTVSLVLAATDLGFSMPDELAILGTDCGPPIWGVPECPRVTSFQISWMDAGRIATDMLVEMLEEGRVDSEGPRLVAPRVAPGETCPVGKPAGAGSTRA